MASRLIKFIHLPRPDQRLFAEIFCLTGVVRLAILLLPFRRLSPHLGKHMQESPVQEDEAKLNRAKQIGRMIEKVSRYTPWESKCLVQAVTGKILLRRIGIDNTLYMGVRKKSSEKLVAHAWLRCGELILTGGRGCDKFAVVGKFADNRWMTDFN